MDIDLSTDLSAVPTAIKELDNCPFVIGSRYDKGSNIAIKQPLKRRFISKCSRIIIKSMFHFKLKETQCGFKAMSKDIAKLFVEKSIIDRFAFDVEYLYIAKLNNIPYNRSLLFGEMTVDLQQVSLIHLIDSLKIYL